MAESIKIGTEEHKELLCRFFIDSHKPYEPKKLLWPDFNEDCRNRLSLLPFWNEAARTEAEASMKLRELGKIEKDPLLREAINLQAYEEGRHAEIIQLFCNQINVKLHTLPNLKPPRNPYLSMIQFGYGECIDSLFGFGAFSLACHSGYIPQQLGDFFDRIMQEEARHILFYMNWLTYHHAQGSFFKKIKNTIYRGIIFNHQIIYRATMALKMKSQKKSTAQTENFTIAAHQSFGNYSLRQLLETCLIENEHRLSVYDKRLLRPTIMPTLVQYLLKLLPKNKKE